MPDFPVNVRAKDYVTERGFTARSLRLYVTVQIGSVNPPSFVDTGAPFSFASFSVARQIRWQLLGSTFVALGRPSPIDWQSIPCDLGETTITLHDPTTASQSRPVRLIGKFARARHSVLPNSVVLGMNFVTDNSIDFVLHGVPGSASGVLSVP